METGGTDLVPRLTKRQLKDYQLKLFEGTTEVGAISTYWS